MTNPDGTTTTTTELVEHNDGTKYWTEVGAPLTGEGVQQLIDTVTAAGGHIETVEAISANGSVTTIYQGIDLSGISSADDVVRMFQPACRQPNGMPTPTPFDPVAVGPGDPLWLDVLSQLQDLVSGLELPAVATSPLPAGPEVWDGWLVNGPYAVGDPGGLAAITPAPVVDASGAWILSVVAVPLGYRMSLSGDATVATSQGMFDLSQGSRSIPCGQSSPEGTLPEWLPSNQAWDPSLPVCGVVPRRLGALSVSSEVDWQVVGFLNGFAAVEGLETQVGPSVSGAVIEKRPHELGTG